MEIKEYIETLKQVENLTIEKNTKGYNYSFKLLGNVDDLIDRAEKIDIKLKSKFNKEVN